MPALESACKSSLVVQGAATTPAGTNIPASAADMCRCTGFIPFIPYRRHVFLGLPLACRCLKVAGLLCLHTSDGGGRAGEPTKEGMRQQLAVVTAWHPGARPTRGNLKQALQHAYACTLPAAPALGATPVARAPDSA